jgi:hypothetical protein
MAYKVSIDDNSVEIKFICGIIYPWQRKIWLSSDGKIMPITLHFFQRVVQKYRLKLIYS